MEFANTEYFRYAWWLVLGLLALWYFARWRKRKIAAIANPSFLAVMFPGYKNRGYLMSATLLLLALSFIILALANPVGTSKPVKGKTSGLDIVFALDVSKSMDAQDLKPSRLDRATHLVREMSEKLSGDRMGLVVFAGDAYVQMPLTKDANAMNLFLSNVNTNMIPQQGTDIEGAIETSKGLLFPDGAPATTNKASKIIILLSDGEDHDGDATRAAKQAGRQGVVIMTVGMGTADGAPIPIYDSGLLQGYLKDNNGETVVTKMEPAALKDIAAEAHGSFYETEGNGNLVPELIKALSSLFKGEESFELFDLKETHFQWFAGIALFLLLMETVFKNGIAGNVSKDEE